MENESFAHLVPHAGRMLLIDRVVSWDERSLHARCLSHLAPDNPLRRDDRLSVLHALEYGAQAMAVHGGLLAERSGESRVAGFLASGRRLRFYRDRLDDLDSALEVRVEQQHVQQDSLAYLFRVSAAEQLVAEGMAIVMPSSPARAATSRS